MLPDWVSNPGPLTYRLRYAARLEEKEEDVTTEGNIMIVDNRTWEYIQEAF